MDIKQLRTLIHVAELGSLSKASLRLGVAQPALSRQIRMLEAELGSPLFERHGRGMVPTLTGREVLGRASQILKDMEALREAATPAQSDLVGTVAIGTTPTVGEIVTVPLVTRLKRAHPRVSVRLSSAFSGYLIDWVKRGELDFAIVYDPAPSPVLNVMPLMIEDLLLVGAGSDALSLDRPFQFQNLEAEPLVLPSPQHGLRKIVEAYALKAGIRLHASVEADSFNAMISLVQSGFGKTLLPLAPIYQTVREGRLCAAPLIDPTPVRRLGLAFPVDRATTQAARLAAGTLIEITSELVTAGIWTGRLLERPMLPDPNHRGRGETLTVRPSRPEIQAMPKR